MCLKDETTGQPFSDAYLRDIIMNFTYLSIIPRSLSLIRAVCRRVCPALAPARVQHVSVSACAWACAKRSQELRDGTLQVARFRG
jgi:hypothetical protein